MVECAESNIAIELTQAEAKDLMLALNESASTKESQELSSLLERVSDSLWLSGWKRDNVRLELDATTRGESVEAIEDSLRHSKNGEEDTQTLERILHLLGGISENWCKD